MASITWPAGTPGILMTVPDPEPVAVLELDERMERPWLVIDNTGRVVTASLADVRLVGASIRDAIASASRVITAAEGPAE